MLRTLSYGRRGRTTVVSLLLLLSSIATISCDPGTGFSIVNERDEALIVHTGGSSSFTIGVGDTDSIGVLLNSDLGTLVITGQDTEGILFDQFLTWDQMTEMEFRLVID